MICLVFRLLVAGIAGTLPFQRLEDVSDALMNILTETHPEGVQWLGEATGMLPDNLASSPERENLLRLARQSEVDSYAR